MPQMARPASVPPRATRGLDTRSLEPTARKAVSTTRMGMKKERAVKGAL